MTCIVGLIDHGDVYFGADSMVSIGESVQTTYLAEPKIWATSESLWGVAGPIQAMQALKCLWVPPKNLSGLSKEAYLTTLLPQSLRKVLAKAKCPKEEADLLFSYQGTLCSVVLQATVPIPVLSHAYPFMAIGAGEDFALGSMHTTEGTGMPPQERLQKALEAAVFGAHFVRPPFNFLHLPAVREIKE